MRSPSPGTKKQAATSAPEPTTGLGPEFLQANMIGPSAGRMAQVPEPPGPANPDQLPADATVTAAAAAEDSDQGSNGGRRWTIPTAVKDLKSGPFETVARGLFRALGGLINSRVQVDDDDASFIADQEDDELFAPAVGRVAARHMPLPDKADMTELEDIGIAIVALANWAAKGLISAWDARAAKRRARAVLRGTGAAVYTGGPGEMQEQTQ